MNELKIRTRSIATIVLFWLILQVGGLFTPGLLDDVDSVYLEIAREMLHRHDYVTPYIDGIRFFDKPPLMYWMAALSMRVLGETDWAGRIPLALAVLALLLAVYALGRRLYPESDRGAFYSSLALATAIGPYLYTRFYIPDILIALWMTLSVHLFLIALDRVKTSSALIPSLLFAATLALNLLTKGLIGIVFPILFVLLYLFLTRQFRALPKLHLIPSTLVFAAIALPWHVMAALRNPAIPMPSGLGLPQKAGWAWFYLYNEHFARFLGKRIPHDYGQTPVWLFWLYAAIWIMPWTTFLPGAIATIREQLGHRIEVTIRQREAALTVTLWALIVLIFFTLSSRQEYYQLPALPALALMAGGQLARNTRSNLTWHARFLVPLASLVAIICAFYALTAPHPAPQADLFTVLTQNVANYNLSLGHLFDLTGPAMGFFRLPLALTAIGMLILGPASYLLRRKSHSHAANLTLAAGMTVVLLAAHEGLVRFNPILGSKGLSEAILTAQQSPRPDDLILIDGELTAGSTLLFYTRQPVHLVEGRVNGPWFGSFWPDAPPIFETNQTLHTLWSTPRRLYILTYNPAPRTQELSAFGPVHTLASAGGKTILTNH
ncbi:ArnT family glycosyltransferase [Granulicella tundricola]|uniref:Glycosyl transferase family 39 n=1 Tax=Granulicella tundricola (strain ATCC BAA-1859 / DSM 23138 / MP5ACTX9) TaxID=1198114 RepID=E8X2A0_GRATM|nr:glycosyltransferase family 39 protein [Granulicella tundricola]ADW68032.1 glycosyl transferase family 39 [Granulicella tundricola MP5ACTX9]